MLITCMSGAEISASGISQDMDDRATQPVRMPSSTEEREGVITKE